MHKAFRGSHEHLLNVLIPEFCVRTLCVLYPEAKEADNVCTRTYFLSEETNSLLENWFLAAIFNSAYMLYIVPSKDIENNI